MTIEKPICVIKNPGRHRTETRVFAREFYETYCVESTCKFYKKRAIQGLCHTWRKPSPDIVDWTRLKIGEAHAEHAVQGFRKTYGPKARTRALETYYVGFATQIAFLTEQLIRLRRENAIFRNILGDAKAEKAVKKILGPR